MFPRLPPPVCAHRRRRPLPPHVTAAFPHRSACYGHPQPCVTVCPRGSFATGRLRLCTTVVLSARGSFVIGRLWCPRRSIVAWSSNAVAAAFGRPAAAWAHMPMLLHCRSSAWRCSATVPRPAPRALCAAASPLCARAMATTARAHSSVVLQTSLEMKPSSPEKEELFDSPIRHFDSLYTTFCIPYFNNWYVQLQQIQRF